MSRLINPDSAGKDRTRLSKAIVLAVRELAKQTQVNQETKDLAAFIALALKQISTGIDASVAATIYAVWRSRFVASTVDAALRSLPKPGSQEPESSASPAVPSWARKKSARARRYGRNSITAAAY